MVARIALGAEEFRRLVSGEVVRDTGAHGRLVVEIILSDIGFARMQEILASERAAKYFVVAARGGRASKCGACRSQRIISDDSGGYQCLDCGVVSSLASDAASGGGR
jgi:hypothetical protein